MTDSWHGYSLVGGHVALDLVNTLAWRGDPSQTYDRLPAPGFLTLWLGRTGLAQRLDPGPAVIDSLIDLRETVYRLLSSPTTEDVARFAALLASARRLATAAPALPLRWTVPVTTADEIVPALTMAADDLLTSPDAAKVRRCAGPRCGWLFLDRTRNHSRQWCSSQDCGNRERARRHYRKTRAQENP
ncbi:CGNR zinc finger domain-containing protein [Kibdelosporangium persicum]|uniref:CGNR zinc finger n=1 Tax=Kibdelosporangium persicum TaxID=2698649 RepID=A0ABX2F7V8_9PSEU|nr:CGNR zinc finger domain-containing protein [Kibdelosporangium persicum]NRN66977.1 CGNR zinc finger [Kibdelosporangium persicum]